MKQPEKWKETINPFSIKFNNFKLVEVLGYPHTWTDVFYCKGIHNNCLIFCFIKYASKNDSNLTKESEMINALNFNFLPEIIDFDSNGKFIVICNTFAQPQPLGCFLFILVSFNLLYKSMDLFFVLNSWHKKFNL